MKVLKEAEAVQYLGRLDQTLCTSLVQMKQGKEKSPFSEVPPFPYYHNILQIELSYFQRLIRSETTRGLAALAVSSSGFPEMLSLQVDVKKAYEELEVIQSHIGDAVFPLFDNLDATGDLATFDSAAERVASDFRKDQEHIDLLKRLKKQAQAFNPDSPKMPEVRNSYYEDQNADKGFRIFTNEEKQGLLFFETGCPCSTRERVLLWEYQEGFLKYIDSSTSPILVVFVRNVVYAPKQEYYSGIQINRGNGTLKIFPDNNEILTVLTPLSDAFRETFLSVDFTILPDGAFTQFIRSSAKMGSLLEHIKGGAQLPVAGLEPVPQKSIKRWWPFRQ